MMIERVFSAQAIGIRDPANTARSYASKFPRDCVVPEKDFFLRGEEADEFLADVAESDECEIVGANGNSSAVDACSQP
jgi:hypothetical protein